MPEKELIHYTITGAQDWPMFKMMFGVVAGVFGLLWAIITALIGVMWHDLRTRISTQRVDDRASCKECHANSTREFDSLWTKVDECCRRMGIGVADESSR